MGKGEVDLVHYDLIFPTGFHGQWRTKEVFRCEVCGAKTNYVHMGGYPGRHLVVVCPGTKYFEHDALEKLVNKMLELDKRIRLFKEGMDNPEVDMKKAMIVIDGLELERLLLKTKIEKARAIFEKVSDVVGLDLAQVKEYEIIYAGGARISPSAHLEDAVILLEGIGYSEYSAEIDCD